MTASASVVDWQDRAEGLEADLRSAVQVAYKRGAREWARLNYPDWIEWLESCTPHPAEQDAREAVARVAEILAPYLTVINSTPTLLSLLYDAGMLPEQTVTVRGAISVAAVCEAYGAAQAAPDGWVLVPVEPTEAMVDAVSVLDRGSRDWRKQASGSYRAMLSASPAPPAQGAGR